MKTGTIELYQILMDFIAKCLMLGRSFVKTKEDCIIMPLYIIRRQSTQKFGFLTIQPEETKIIIACPQVNSNEKVIH